jgi:hypothetical protein
MVVGSCTSGRCDKVGENGRGGSDFHYNQFVVPEKEIPSDELLQRIELDLWERDRLTSDDCRSIQELREAVELHEAGVLAQQTPLLLWIKFRPRLEYLVSLNKDADHPN